MNYGTISKGNLVVKGGDHFKVEDVKEEFSAAIKELANR
jgi:hypothetical protein